MLYRKSTLAVLLALIFFSFFGTLTASAWMFPKSYDWRYRVISNLLSPRDNPNHYWLAASGVALTGLLMLPFAGLLRRHLEVIGPRSAKLSAATFTAGMIALICACANSCVILSVRPSRSRAATQPQLQAALLELR
jgi:hypothetical protein